MKITIQDIVTLHRAGGRSENEDRIFPEEDRISTADRRFVVCDGVGGNPGGERAAQLVGSHFSAFLAKRSGDFPSKELLEQALRYAERQLDDTARAYPEYEGMATTLAYLGLTIHGAVIAWVGDSRVMQIREGKIIRQTKDHSLVNALLDFGEITPAEAQVHPKRNMLLRAVSGSAAPAKLDVLYVDDIMPGDYFLLCSDGIIEGVGDQWPELLSEDFSPERLRYEIDLLCRKQTSDNYSMILLQIGQVADLQPVNAGALNESAPVSARVDGPELYRTNRRSWRYALLLLFPLSFLGWWWLSIPIGLQATWIGGGVLIRDGEHKVLIDAFPLSERIREQQRLAPVRRKLLTGARPFDGVEVFLVAHLPANLETDTLRSFLKQYLEQNEQVRLHPQMLRQQLANDRPAFLSLYWTPGELGEPTGRFVERLPTEPEAGFSAFVFYLSGKTVLYVGDPGGDIDFLQSIEIPVDCVLINEWILRTGTARRTLLSFIEDRSVVILPSDRPMNNRQRQEIREALPRARFLNAEQNRVRLR